MRCMLNIWGVMLFLRISWVVGQAGLSKSNVVTLPLITFNNVEALVIVCCGNSVTIITAISMSAVATNGLIKGGMILLELSD
ncbi:hypothetical protein HAZT_HAZT008124 [Hyalella azteca]|uniref:Uncharacterized protein n=1 Tax=Hyalella azteca TaxID=294128 RepID=A0A6A0H8Z5_HYAAZ|nr:hypothetical protein HAZT_HAZT008124 [Hyalella azteca]